MPCESVVMGVGLDLAEIIRRAPVVAEMTEQAKVGKIMQATSPLDHNCLLDIL